MKRWISIILLLCIIIGTTACSGAQNTLPGSAATTAVSGAASAPSSMSSNEKIGTVPYAAAVHWDEAFQTVDGFGGSEAFKKK